VLFRDAIVLVELICITARFKMPQLTVQSENFTTVAYLYRLLACLNYIVKHVELWPSGWDGVPTCKQRRFKPWRSPCVCVCVREGV